MMLGTPKGIYMLDGSELAVDDDARWPGVATMCV